MKKLIILLAACIFTGIVSCKKDDITNGDGNCLTGSIEDSKGYFPNSDGTSRSYDYSEIIFSGFTLTHATESATQVFNGKTYRKIQTKINGASNSVIYVAEHLGNFYTLGEVQISGFGYPSYTQSNNDTEETLFLKPDAAVGSTWYENMNRDFDEGPTRVRFKILAKDGTRTVNSKSYDDVITLEGVTEYTCDGCTYAEARFLHDSTVYYFAKGIGLIEYSGVMYDLGGDFSAELKCYDIK